MAEGWISVHRKVKESWIWQDKEPYDKRSAWIDILISANHKDAKVLMDNKLVLVKRGQFITSEVKLSERWKWGRTAVRNYLQLLENDEMIHKIVQPNKYTVIEIVNYDKYQIQTTDDTTQSTQDTKLGAVSETIDQTTDEQQTDNSQTRNKQHTNTNNNDNNENNENNENKKNIYAKNRSKKKDEVPKVKYAEYVSMTEEEHQRLVNQFGSAKVVRMIEVLDNYKGSTGKSYKSDYRAILNWVVDKISKERPIKQQQQPQPGKHYFNNYSGQRNYDIDELEKQLLGRAEEG